ncbi:uncharacterized protein LOC120676721 isoform X3 [Panicum virgatum]|uniref:uncharacterized protein LOC120676721 isoform X3 n=1 Tax=Panicum virgatum TaxID=38727 RepID=UPI0019D51963|nr:uncharacterized protein LOC120676721 isoform X3 [Panicum virgatum]
MLQFQHTSMVNRLQTRGGTIPRFAFNLCPFDQLPSKNIRSKPLIDLIGVISDVGPYDFASPTSNKKLRKIQICDLEEQTQQLLLCSEHGESFDGDNIIQQSKNGIVVAIFAGLTVGNFSGQIEASSSSATQVFIDSDLQEIVKFRESYQWEPPALQRHLPQILQKSPIEAAGQIYKIEQLTALQPSSFQRGATYSCIAKITAIVPSIKWYYKACLSCKIGYNSISETPRCDCATSQPMPMFKLPLALTDDTGSIEAIAFSSIAEDLVERNAYQASQNMKIHATDHAASLQTAVGKIRLFHIGMSTDMSSNFSIKYVIRKSFPIDKPPSTSLLSHNEFCCEENYRL